MRARLIITDRSGNERQVIDMRQDGADPSKWHLAEPFELAADESSHIHRDGQSVGVPYSNGPSPAVNTIFLAER